MEYKILFYASSLPKTLQWRGRDRRRCRGQWAPAAAASTAPHPARRSWASAGAARPRTPPASVCRSGSCRGCRRCHHHRMKAAGTWSPTTGRWSHHLDKYHDFQISFPFSRILKQFGHKFVFKFREQDVKNFLSVPGSGLTIDSITWMSSFYSFITYFWIIFLLQFDLYLKISF